MSESLIAPGDLDEVAAEYVLGTLDPDERSAAQQLITEDAEFAAKVKVWEGRLGELHLMVEPVEPEPDIWQRIKSKLPEPQFVPPPVIAPEEPLAALEPESQARPEAAAQPPAEPEPTGEPDRQREFELALMRAVELDLSPAPSPQAEPKIEPPNLVPDVESTDRERFAAQPEVAAPPDCPPAVPPGEGAITVESSPLRPEVPPVEATGGQFAPPAARPPAAADRGAERLSNMRWHLAWWRALAVLMALLVLAVGGLVAAWRYEPERIPAALRPLALMRLVGIAVDQPLARRQPPPPESRFDE